MSNTFTVSGPVVADPGWAPPTGVGACTLSNSPDGMGNTMIQDRIKGLSWKEIADKYQLGSPSAARNKFKKLTGIGDFKIKGQDLKHIVDNNLLDQLKESTEKIAKKAVSEVDTALQVGQAEVKAGADGAQALAEKVTKQQAMSLAEAAEEAFLDMVGNYDENVVHSVIEAIDKGQGYTAIKSNISIYQKVDLDFKQIDEIAWHHLLSKADGDVWKAYLQKPTSENGFNAVKAHVFDMQKKGFLNNEIAISSGIPDDVIKMITNADWSMPPMGSTKPVLQKVASPPPSSSGYSPPPKPPPVEAKIHYTHPDKSVGGYQPHTETEYLDWTTKLGNDLTAKQLQAVKTYTGSGYHDMNSKLRNYGHHTDMELIKNMDGVFKDVPFDTTVYRHVDANAFKGGLQSLGGKVYSDAGYMSTAIKDGGFGARRSIKMVIDVPKGTKARYVDVISSNSGEKEMILPRDTKLLVTGVEQKSNGQWIIRMTVMAAA